jgi:hypothetical protein
MRTAQVEGGNAREGIYVGAKRSTHAEITKPDGIEHHQSAHDPHASSAWHSFDSSNLRADTSVLAKQYL